MAKAFLPKILEQKALEVAQMPLEDIQPLRQTYRLYDFLQAHPDRLQIIAEVKKASPSMGDINLGVDILQQAKTYEANGAAMISVLTDQVYFKGHLDDLRAISNQVAIPTLNKDFIIDEKQIIRARNAGASVILLIVAALPEERLKELYDYATELGLEVLVETHNREELEIAHRIGARIIGVNNRNLKTFQVSLETTRDLSEEIGPDCLLVSESGIQTGADAAKVREWGANAILVGEALMRAPDRAAKVAEYKGL